MSTKSKSNGKNGTEMRAELANAIAKSELHAEPRAGDAEMFIPRPVVHTINVRIEGISPLIMCRFNEKDRDLIAAKTEGKAKLKKEAKDPEKEWQGARHRSVDGWDGVHCGAFRAAIISAARNVDGVTMTSLKQCIFIRPDGFSTDGTPLVRLYGDDPECFSSMCRTSTGVTYPRHRPIYKDWSAIVQMQVNGHILSVESAVNLLALAGQFCGVGEWRPTSPKNMTGSYGLFEVKGVVN